MAVRTDAGTKLCGYTDYPLSIVIGDLLENRHQTSSSLFWHGCYLGDDWGYSPFHARHIALGDIPAELIFHRARIGLLGFGPQAILDVQSRDEAFSFAIRRRITRFDQAANAGDFGDDGLASVAASCCRRSVITSARRQLGGAGPAEPVPVKRGPLALFVVRSSLHGLAALNQALLSGLNRKYAIATSSGICAHESTTSVADAPSVSPAKSAA
jgi:hypothetical protein